MKTLLQFALCFAAAIGIYKIGYMEGVKSVNFDMATANVRLQNCIELIK